MGFGDTYEGFCIPVICALTRLVRFLCIHFCICRPALSPWSTYKNPMKRYELSAWNCVRAIVHIFLVVVFRDSSPLSVFPNNHHLSYIWFICKEETRCFLNWATYFLKTIILMFYNKLNLFSNWSYSLALRPTLKNLNGVWIHLLPLPFLQRNHSSFLRSCAYGMDEYSIAVCLRSQRWLKSRNGASFFPRLLLVWGIVQLFHMTASSKTQVSFVCVPLNWILSTLPRHKQCFPFCFICRMVETSNWKFCNCSY